MTEHNSNNCLICFMQINDVDKCVTVCNHIFHTGCIIRCNHSCPICRTDLITNTSRPANRVQPGVYNMDEYMKQLEINNISIDNISSETKGWIEECQEYKEIQEKIKIEKIKKQEKSSKMFP